MLTAMLLPRFGNASLTVASVFACFLACAVESSGPKNETALVGHGGTAGAAGSKAGASGGSAGSVFGSAAASGASLGGSSAGTGGNAGASASAGSSAGSGSSGGTGSSGSAGTAGSGGAAGTSGSGGGGSGYCDGPSDASRTTARCGSTILYKGVLYRCVSQDQGVNGEPTGCGTQGARCGEIDPDHPGWGTTAWAPVPIEDCSGDGGAGGAGGNSSGGDGSGGA